MVNLTVYESVVKKFDRQKIEKIEEILSELEKSNDDDIKCIIINLRKEVNVPEQCVRKILNYINSSKFNPDKFLAKYEAICKDYKLKGRLVLGLENEYLGNAVYKEALKFRILFANSLSSLIGFDLDKFNGRFDKYIKDIDGIADRSRIDGYDKFIIHDGNMWATWEEKSYPFDFMRTRDLHTKPAQRGCACEVRLSLALHYKGRNTVDRDSMLLLTYKAAQIEIHIPTIADAGNYKYFLPCSQNENHGLTNPKHQDLRNYYVDQCLIPSVHPNYNDEPRPEAVHKSITIGCLHSIEELQIPKVTLQ